MLKSESHRRKSIYVLESSFQLEFKFTEVLPPCPTTSQAIILIESTFLNYNAFQIIFQIYSLCHRDKD